MISPLHPLRVGRRLLSLSLVLALGACTNLHNDRTRTKTEGALAGAGAGALLGTAAGAAMGGKNKQKAMLAGAAAGAVVGGLAGAAHGEAVARKKEGYTQTEDALGARLSTAKRQLSDRRTYNLGLKYEIARHEQRLASLRTAGHSAGRAVEQFELRSTLGNRIGELDRQARDWQETIDAHKAALKAVSGDPRAAALRTEINDLAAEKSELLRQKGELVSISKRAR